MTTEEQHLLYKVKDLLIARSFPFDVPMVAARDVKLIPGFESVSIKEITAALISLGAKSLPLIAFQKDNHCAIALMTVYDHEETAALPEDQILRTYYHLDRILKEIGYEKEAAHLSAGSLNACS